jgi:hypothetical protein
VVHTRFRWRVRFRLDLRLLAGCVAVWGDRGDLGGGGGLAMAVTPGRKLTRAKPANQIGEWPHGHEVFEAG